jgi:hypothetical protein
MMVFISYGGASDQVTALRLQALGAVNGLTVYVPPAFTRRGVPTLFDPEADQKLNEAEVVLDVVGAGLTEACRQELNAGIALHKNMIVMTYPASAPELQPYFGSNLVVIDPDNPDAAEIGIVRHLKVAPNLACRRLKPCTAGSTRRSPGSPRTLRVVASNLAPAGRAWVY